MTTAATCPFDHHAITDATSAPGIYADLRDNGVVYSTEHGGFYVLTRHADVLAALRDPDTFASGFGTRIPTVGEGRVIPLDTDPPSHTAYRSLVTDWITPQTVRGMTEDLRALIDRLIDDYLAKGGGDWVNEVGLPLPLNVLTHVVGFSPETVVQFRDLTEESWRVISETDLLDARAGLRELVRAEVARYRASGEPGYINTLLAREIDERPITDDEAERILLAFAVAGHETTMHASSAMVSYLADDPTRQELLRERPDLIPAFVEETLRFSSPVQTMARYVTRDAEIAGVRIPAGSRVLLVHGGANRDPEKFDHAEEFDPLRNAAGHLAFGFGRHQCAGALLARTELRLVLEKLITLPQLEYAGPVEYGPLSGGAMAGPASVPLRFTDAFRTTHQTPETTNESGVA
ncbi:cytochrome P450 [Nocardioides panzhihuensis]|uniref:Cytochrome P450 n=1 Tax=Nocardioides panzhihuensis TaxID=860243 RepID=A0A7Z0IUV2_9ACTN|nr:cytochrome P450 [Nocardioides panzhihuensis]NYI80391.1 cytochrome P450 [Nocardioides panzhihuensis]